MLAPAPVTGAAAPPITPDRRADAPQVPAAPAPTAGTSPRAVQPAPETESARPVPPELPPAEIDETPPEPADLIASLNEVRDTDVAPIDPGSDGPFGPPPAFDRSPLQAQREGFPNLPDELLTETYSASQQALTPDDPTEIGISKSL